MRSNFSYDFMVKISAHLENYGNLLKINSMHFLTEKLQNILKIIETQRKIFSGTA